MVRHTTAGAEGQVYGLAVDDTRLTRQLMAWTLSQAGCIPISASDGQAGLLLVESLMPKVVITDLDMGRWGGLQLIQAMRTSVNPVVRATPVIVCSVTGNTSAITEAFDAGASKFLAKPINVVALREMIFEVLIEPINSHGDQSGKPADSL